MKTARTFVIGDIHGAYSALLQCMERSSFNYKSDRLICLGDICDRRPGVKECVDELLKIQNRVIILGNHDYWALDWMTKKGNPDIWLLQGGAYTIESYKSGIPDSHRDFFQSALYYFTDENRLFVHGGINHTLAIDVQLPDTFLWDRSLVSAAIEFDGQEKKLTSFDEVYVGHTPTLNIFKRISSNTEINKSDTQNIKASKGQTDQPIKLCNVWLMDTGAGWPGGRLSIMNIETKEIFQSDILN
jgi:serine/threonine protein phosphatase 1